MLFEQIDNQSFTVSFTGMDDMGKIATEAVRLINSHFDELVKEINCDWDTKKITLKLRTSRYSQVSVDNRLRGSTHCVEWKDKSFKIRWKREGTAESYHSAFSAEQLEEEYKDKTAYLCNKKDSTWVIDEIVPN